MYRHVEKSCFELGLRAREASETGALSMTGPWLLLCSAEKDCVGVSGRLILWMGIAVCSPDFPRTYANRAHSAEQQKKDHTRGKEGPDRQVSVPGHSEGTPSGKTLL